MNGKTASQTSSLQLADAYNQHPIVWLDPSVYNASNRQYTSIDHAKQAYNKEKQDIISCYERQLQRVLSQFSIALKQIEYLEDFRKQQNKNNHHLNHYKYRNDRNDRNDRKSSIEMNYDSIIEQLNRKIRIMHEEMVNMKNLYIKKIDIISQQKQHEINELKHGINGINGKPTKYQQKPQKIKLINKVSGSSSSSSSSSQYLNDDHLRNRSIPNTPSNWMPEKQAVSMEDTRINKLYKIEEEYNTLQSEYKSSLEEIDKLKIKISNNSNKIQQIDQGKKTPHDQLHKLHDLKCKNVDLEKQLKAAQISHRILLKKQKDESFLKAKKKIMNKEARQLQEEEFKLQLEEVQINKDIVINRLAAEYHEMADKEEKHEKELEELTEKLNNMAISHKSQITQLKDEYVSRIHYHRKQIQDYLNSFLKQKENKLNNINNQKNGRRTSQVLDDDDIQHNHQQNNNQQTKPGKFFNLHITSPVINDEINGININDNNNNNEYSMSLSHSHESELSESFASHSRNDSDMSQISQSADEIVTSLVIGIDEQLDDILTPVVNNRINPYEQFSIFDVEDSKLQTHNTAISEISGITEITPTKGQHTHISSLLQHQPKDTFTYLEYGITPRDVSTHMPFKSGDSDFNDSPPEPSITNTFTDLNNANITSSSSNVTASLSSNTLNTHTHNNNNNTLRGPLHLGPRSNASLLFANPMISMINGSSITDAVGLTMKNNTYQELAEQCLEYEETMNRYEKEIEELRESLNEILRKNEEQETEIRSLKEKNRKSKRKEFDWVTKEREYKSLLAQYRELRENNAKLTLTYFTLQCEYDKLKRDYDEKSAMVMNYGDYQINLTNQIMISNDNTSSENSSNRNLLLSNNHSNNSNHSNCNEFEAIQMAVSPPMGHVMGGDLDILSDISNEDDEVDMVVGFMASTAQRNTQVMNVNDITASPPNGLINNNCSLGVDGLGTSNSNSNNNKHKSQNASIMSNHGYNMSYFGNNLAFQYTAKTKEELIDDILKLKDQLSEMTDTKFSILQSTKQEIDRLTSKVKMLEEQREHEFIQETDLETNIHEIQLDQEMANNNTENKKQRKSFGGGTIGLMSNDDHTYTVSKNDLDSVAKQLANKQHTRTQSMANSKYLLPGNNDRKTKIIQENNNNHQDKDKIFDENQEDDDNNNHNKDNNDNDNNHNDDSNDNNDDLIGHHIKSLTVLHNVTNSDEIED